MRTTGIRMLRVMKTLIPKLTALVLALCFLPAFALAEDTEAGEESEWVNFLLICNEGMNNDKGNAGNTLMVVAMNPSSGKIRLMMFTWDTFVDYEGYDVPQKLDMPYRNNGPEECVRVFNENFNIGIKYYLSLNYLNLASLIDAYGGINVDISRAERNALNGMVASKHDQLQAQIGSGILSQAVLELLTKEYYLTEFGSNTHLNGLQAVGFGWLQYDSVYNCCLREVKVIANLFSSVGAVVANHVAFYTNETGAPEDLRGRRAINLDAMTEDDHRFIRRELDPIFQMSFHNLPDEVIDSISIALVRVAYQASRQGVNILEESLKYKIFPLEATEPYDIVAGAKGHIVDKEKNTAAMKEFMAQN